MPVLASIDVTKSSVWAQFGGVGEKGKEERCSGSMNGGGEGGAV